MTGTLMGVVWCRTHSPWISVRINSVYTPPLVAMTMTGSLSLSVNKQDKAQSVKAPEYPQCNARTVPVPTFTYDSS